MVKFVSDLFKALGNLNRRSMIKLLMQQDFHISGIAKELNIAVPVALKHAQILEEVGLIEREIVGNIYLPIQSEPLALCIVSGQKLERGAKFILIRNVQSAIATLHVSFHHW